MPGISLVSFEPFLAGTMAFMQEMTAVLWTHSEDDWGAKEVFEFNHSRCVGECYHDDSR